ncbi:hypothetical protein DUI87_08143 [Hirundo rustica rustica]|uniref:ribonuclease H n=1 Tax=Hirundo rustica rustica TaxID=333673 RepID=A0A3M0L9L6_HIRRU|nr:hypothetical protein DUI87_08143 [Hirundo rustica rustica]
MKLNKSKCWILHLGLASLGWTDRLGYERIKSNTTESHVGVLVNGKLNLNQQCPGSQEGQLCPGVHQTQHRQVGKDTRRTLRHGFRLSDSRRNLWTPRYPCWSGSHHAPGGEVVNPEHPPGPLQAADTDNPRFRLVPGGVNRPRVRFSLAEDSIPQNGSPTPYPQDGGDRMAQSSPSPYPPSFNPFLPALDKPNPFLSLVPPIPPKDSAHVSSFSRTPPSAPPSYSSHGNAHMTSSGSQTMPPAGRPASWASGSHAPPAGSHAPPPGSHGLGPEGAGPGPEPAGMHQPSPVPSVSPVVYKGSRGGHNVRAVHHPFSQATIRDLCKAHRDYGWDSPYFRGLLRSNLKAAVVIPADLRQLFSCLLDSTEFKLWEAAWRQLLREALLSLLTDPETAVDENGNALTLEQLMGEGRWTDPTDQASSIPTKALQTIREHAVTAFCSMVPDGPVIPYYKIVQGTKEAFTKFVERLTQAIEVQVSEVAVREGILREMVFANANNLCRTAILSLPLDPPPTLQDMLRVCQLKVPYMQGNDRDAKSPTPRVAAISGTQQEHVRMPLELTKALHLKSVDWTFLSVNLKEQGAWPVQGKELVVIRDCKYTPQEIEILPGILTNNPENLVLWLRCTHPPTFLPKGQIIAQIIPARGPNATSTVPVACPVQAITEERPRVKCKFTMAGETMNITAILDTGADVMIMPAQDWPSHWALQDVAGHIQGVGGLQLARQSKSVVQIKGPKGQLGNIHPFVLNYKEPLLGRDLMAQWGVKIDIPDPSVDISTATIEERPTKKLNWLTDNPVWVEQWPLSKQKLKALEELVEEQLRKGHIVETDSPWNSPVFVIQKPGKDKWRLLQDLRQINNVIEDMGSLQPGMPSPTMLPENWKLAIIDIKDCFFQIPLHPDDAPRFAFSVPTINREAPRKRYHWWVLPQGMKNSPVICQWYVASLLSPVRAAAGQAIIHHYMDDVLVCAPTDDVLTHALDLTINARRGKICPTLRVRICSLMTCIPEP